MSRCIVPVTGRLAVLLTLSCCAPPMGAQETLTQFLSGHGPKDAVPWDFSVTGGRRAGTWATIPVPSNWELQGFGSYNYGQESGRSGERYKDGTVNHWEKIERPGVLLENGHVAYFTFAVLDVPKDQEKSNDNHGSKVIVVPFDGAALDRDMQQIVKAEQKAK